MPRKVSAWKNLCSLGSKTGRLLDGCEKVVRGKSKSWFRLPFHAHTCARAHTPIHLPTYLPTHPITPYLSGSLLPSRHHTHVHDFLQTTSAGGVSLSICLSVCLSIVCLLSLLLLVTSTHWMVVVVGIPA